MFKGWKLVAQLGRTKGRYPHILVDPYNWCLRLGPKKARDDKFYSSLPSLLKGLLEHLARRKMLTTRVLSTIEDFRDEIRYAFKTFAEAGLDLEEKGVLKRDTLPVEPPPERRPTLGGRTPAWTPQIIPGGG